MPSPESNLFERAVILSVDTHGIGASKKIDTSLISVRGDPDEKVDTELLSASKKLFQCEQYDSIRSLYTEMRAYLRRRSIPVPKNSPLSRLFRGGVYLQPIATIEEVDRQLGEYRSQLRPAVTALADIWDKLLGEMSSKLGPLYEPKDYPTSEEVKRAFYFDWQYVQVTTPDKISKEILEREREKSAALWASANEEANRILVDGYAKVLANLVEKLQPGDDGKMKTFRDNGKGAVSQLREFMDLFNSRNITDNEELAALVVKAKAYMDGITPNSLRASPAVRSDLKNKMEELAKSVNEMQVELAPERKIDLED